MKFAVILLLVTSSVSYARTEVQSCGTHAYTGKEELFLHRQALQKSRALKTRPAALAGLPDSGNIALLEDTDGVVAARNLFDLFQQSITFTPSSGNAKAYSVQVGNTLFDQDAADNGDPVSKLGDDDSREFTLPFTFNFYGQTYKSIYLNSDGNLTFKSSDAAHSDRSLGRFVAGPPRIAPFFTDLDPSKSLQGGVAVLSTPAKWVATWVQVPVYSANGGAAAQTFQAALYPDGHIEFSFDTITANSAVVGITPGGNSGPLNLLSFAQTGSSSALTGSIVERFADSTEVDTVTAAQKFYQNHQDAYDYLVFFNDEGIAASLGAVAYEVTVRNNRSGYGDTPVDDGAEYGSPHRLQAVLNMGPTSQYPVDPNALVPSRAPTPDTPITLLGHETGHLFLAYASVPDPADPNGLPMLGRQLVHWSFYFDSEASLLEGNQIKDNGAGANPRFTTSSAVQGYSPLDQYLMGFRTPAEVPDVFYVQNGSSGALPPQVGVSFNGTRKNVQIQDVIAAVGRRTPDSTVAQRRFRFAFVIITPQGLSPDPSVVAQVEQYRTQFEAAYGRFSSGRAIADTGLKSEVELSLAPAAGVLMGSTVQATVSLAGPAATPITFTISTPNGNVQTPATVTIPAGSRQAAFPVQGITAGVEELLVTPADSRYETAAARVQVLDAPASLTLSVVSGDKQLSSSGSPLSSPILVSVTDINGLPYAGVAVSALPSAGGSVSPVSVLTAASGVASFVWTTGSGAQPKLQFTLSTVPSVTAVALAVGRPSVFPGGIVNAASFAPGLAAGGIGSVFGVNFAGGEGTPAPNSIQVLINGSAVPLYYTGDGQINFVVPAGTPVGTAQLSVVSPLAASDSVAIPVTAIQPGVFNDGKGNGAILIANTALTTQQRPAKPQDYLEIYSTGLGQLTAVNGFAETVATPQVTIAGVTAKVVFSGLSPGVNGLYQVDVQVPAGVPSGRQPLILSLSGQAANTVYVQIQ